MQLISSYYYINYGLNKVDRSLYYTFYEDLHFKDIESLLIQKIVTLSAQHDHNSNIHQTIKEFSNISENKNNNCQINTKNILLKNTTLNTNTLNFNNSKHHSTFISSEDNLKNC